MLYTIVHVLFGASLVATALTVMLIHTMDRTEFTPEDLMERVVQMKKERRKKLAKTQDVSKLSVEELRVRNGVGDLCHFQRNMVDGSGRCTKLK